ncbi:MAG: DUF4167 domain-containing protein [Mesorhizobium sp.]|nr:DUF4167 domain-containing protein [Mesorhizobium sp.]
MRPQQQNRRMRGRNNNNSSNNSNNNNRKGPNPLTRNYESNGPDVKIRGSAQQVAEKYMQLARDAHSSGDRVMAENYLQHAEHYNRIIAAAQAQAPVQQQNRDDDDDDDRDDFDSNSNSSFEQPRQVNDGSGPQPVINGVPAEVAFSQDAPQPGGEQPRLSGEDTGNGGNGQPIARQEGDEGSRRSRRPRRGRRPDLDARGVDGNRIADQDDGGEQSPMAEQSSPAVEPDPVG